MGIKYNASESALLIEALTHNVHIANEITDRLSSGCQHLLAALDSGELQGAAYTAGKGLFTDIIIPAITKLQQAVDDIEVELQTYQSAHAEISIYGNLDKEQLLKLKSLKERQLEIVLEQIAENEGFMRQLTAVFSGRFDELWSDTSALYQLKDHLEVGIREVQTKLEVLDWFVSQVNNYFTDSLNVLALAIQGAIQLNQVIVNSDGTYSTAGLDMSWLTKMKEQKLTTFTADQLTMSTKEKRDKALIINDFKNSYGLDEETASILYNLQRAILEKGQKHNWSREKIIYEYNRIVASPIYGERTAWRGLSGVLDWKETSDLEKILVKYGLSAEEIALFQEGVKRQHGSNVANKDFAHESVQLATFTEEAWKDRDLFTKRGRKEFEAHFFSTIGNSLRVGDIDISTEKYESSFRGDVNSGRYSDSDFNSDLDAINMYKRMTSYNVDIKNIFMIQVQYNNAIITNQSNRVEEFYENMGSGDRNRGKEMVKYLMEHDTFGGNYIKSERDNSEQLSLNDFYDYLERGAKSNVGT